ncbi:MAG: hypothetical protein KF819_12480 [Labilithrix sp.]|nr:hypothetical protein [Labilithrix sp.]
MAHTKSLALALSSLFALVACGGAAPGPDGDLAPAEPVEQNAPAAAVDAGADGDVAAPDAGNEASAPPAPQPIAKHCTGTFPEPKACIERVEGRAGDVVQVDLVLLGSSGCTAAGEVGGRIDLDLGRFELTNEGEHVACRTRMVATNVTPGSPDQIVWNAFGEGALGGCPDAIPAGKADTLAIRIKPGTPPGDYALTWGESTVASFNPACQSTSPGANGVIRVLP